MQEFANWFSTPPSYTTLRFNAQRYSVTDIETKLKLTVRQNSSSRPGLDGTIVIHPEIHDVFVISNTGPLQREKHKQEVIVDHACGCAVLRGANVFVQGILAAPADMQQDDVVSVYSDIDGQCRKGLIKAYTGKTVFLGNGVVKASRNDIFVTKKVTSGVGIDMTEPVYLTLSLSGLMSEQIYAQNLPSVVVGHVLGAKCGETVLDMCAAPGGKTTHVASLMQNKGRVVAIDKTRGKIQKLQDHCERWGSSIVEAYAFDSTRLIAENADSHGSPPYAANTFDRVLLDGPCSALGQRPLLRCAMSRKELQSYPKLQKQLFAQAVKAVKPGGVIVYSTCTITTAENEDIVSWALRTFPELTLLKQDPHHMGGTGVQVDGLTVEEASRLQRFGHAGLVTTENEQELLNYILENKFCDQNSTAEKACSITPPTDVNANTIGFFIAKFMKRNITT